MGLICDLWVDFFGKLGGQDSLYSLCFIRYSVFAE